MELSVNPLLQKIVLLSLVFWSDALWACAVCFGDPESSLTKGAVAGVLVLVGIIVSVLGGIAGMALFWAKRARMLASEKQSRATVLEFNQLGMSPPSLN